MDDLKALIEAYEQKRQELRDSCLDLMREHFNKFFAENPTVKRISWTQYAPHFNDGEPCEFDVNEVYFSWLTADEEELHLRELDNQGILYETYKYDSPTWTYMGGEAAIEKWDTNVHPALVAMDTLIHSIPEEIMKDVFGLDSEIIITPEAINIEDYSSEHD